MPDYSQGKIYTIHSHQTDKIYIGSTTQSLKERLRGHKRDYNSWKNGKRDYTSSYEIIIYDDAYIELLEDCSCERKEQLHKREGELIREMDCVNKFIPCRSKKEWREENKERKRRTDRLYRERHNERIKAHKSKKYNCECGGKYTHDHKARHLRTKKHQEYLKSFNNKT